jgi:peptidase E
MPSRTPQIIAMGGGGFSMEPDNPGLDRYILEQSGRERPRVCFVPTASGEAEGYVINFYRAMTDLGAAPNHLFLFQLPTADLEGFIMEHDILYVGGGNTRSMLALWREWELDRILRRAWQEGVILSGLSAGAICWFEQGLSDSVPGKQTVLPGLGYLSGSCCPHYDGESQRRPAYQSRVQSGEILPGYGLDDGAALHYHGTDLYRAVSSRPDARAYRVEPGEAGVREETLAMCYLKEKA